jgi:mono/diheme cytochrome c family protein
MNARFGFWISAFGALLAAISSSFAAEQTAGVDPVQASKGKVLYGTNCVHCHGINMVTPGTVAFDLREFPHDDKARFVNSVTHGKNNRMPPWGDILKPEDIDNLWAYVLTGGKP